MSLNGLDDVKVKEAHDIAAAEPGGWFLLKYTARDEIELLGRGNGGIVEIRNAIASYEEPSPLFGFLRYRRRNVIIKYVPEDCSRLVQARVSVHFTAVTDRFSPHDTIFEINHPKELRDTKLSAACSLHTASGSTSSSTSSLRRRRLMEIAEDEEEDNRKRQSTVMEEHPSTTKLGSVSGAPESAQNSAPPDTLPSTTAYRSTITDDALHTEPPPPRSPTQTVDEAPPRKSSQSTRPDIYSFNSYGSNGKPKVKLGPRPSLDVGGSRPHTSHTSGAGSYRPVSTLPAGLKVASKGSKRGGRSPRPTSVYGTETPSMTISPPPIPGMSHSTPMRPHTSGGRPPTSPNPSIKAISSTPLTPRITPEKARLMKALEMRKRQKSAAAPVEPLSPTSPEGLTSPAFATNGGNRGSGAPKEVHDTLAMLNDMAKEDDSGISFDASSTLKTDESDATRSDSYPVSPVGPSEQTASTRASSISESTDETVQETSTVKPVSIIEESPLEAKLPEFVKVEEKEAVPADAEQLLPMTYQPPSRAVVSVKPTEEAEESEETTPVATLARLDDPIMQEIAPVDSSVIETMADEPRTEVPDDSISAPEFPTQLEVKDVNIPRSKFIQHFFADETAPDSFTVVEAEKAGTEAPENVQEPLPPTKSDSKANIPRSKFSMDNLNSDNKAPETNNIPGPNFGMGMFKGSDEVRETDNIPRSKFSMTNLKSDNKAHEIPTEPLPLSDVSDNSTVIASQKSPVGSTFSVDTKRSFTDNDQENDGTPSKKRKKRKSIEHIRTDLDFTDQSGHTTEANFSSDDDLMDELDSAVVQEAQPISVSKSPVNPVFPTTSPKKRESWRNRVSRVVSNPTGRKEDSSSLGVPPKFETSRAVSASAAFLNKINQEASKPVIKKVNLGSGISQRIKALEKATTTPGTAAAPTTGPPLGAAPAFFSVRKSNGRGTSPSIADRTNSLNKNTPSPGDFTDASRESSPEAFTLRDRSKSIKNRVNTFEVSPVPMMPPVRSRPESISVTARIIRDPASPFPPGNGKPASEYAPLDLKQSPLVIDHQKAIPEHPKEIETIQERRLSRERRLSSSSNTTNTTAKNRRSSISIVKDLISEGRQSFADRRRSIEFVSSISSPSARSSSRPPSVMSPSRPPSTHAASPVHKRSESVSSRLSTGSRTPNDSLSPPPTANSSSDEKEKKSNRTSRMLRRMSSSLSSGRKAISHAVSPTVREESEPLNGNDSRSLISSDPSTTPPTPSINIGDVNVQFPDTLLWKRRSTLLDSSGYLILSPALTASGNGKGKASVGATRKFHLSEFRMPSIPDVEMEELPNSVVLDFVEGGAGGLQIACEDRLGQGRILEVLQEAYQTHAS
ncbi:hypothetical protein LHYA1_G005308 [Lachnellula hyalina]|uniref:ADF-H domain-containing protein n=1 Tax=Lachnellula hyalina TaxID=1316788 RepID=A0A8H8QZS3_9HELO|nr:uncharacterized protein LHYA1_G005308 [Lachnellula hyalina]TVY25773.1 hypothetical protein LHYA1_G005308 [Lachnellula hyalina]